MVVAWQADVERVTPLLPVLHPSSPTDWEEAATRERRDQAQVDHRASLAVELGTVAVAAGPDTDNGAIPAQDCRRDLDDDRQDVAVRAEEIVRTTGPWK